MIPSDRVEKDGHLRLKSEGRKVRVVVNAFAQKIQGMEESGINGLKHWQGYDCCPEQFVLHFKQFILCFNKEPP